jgi:hypothetical protein
MTTTTTTTSNNNTNSTVCTTVFINVGYTTLSDTTNKKKFLEGQVKSTAAQDMKLILAHDFKLFLNSCYTKN